MLVECRACNSRLSRKAYSCPACGHPNERVTRVLWVTAVALIAVAFALMYLRWQRHEREADRAEAALVRDLARNYSTLEQAGANPKETCQFGRYAIRVAEQYGTEHARPLKIRVARACQRAGI